MPFNEPPQRSKPTLSGRALPSRLRPESPSGSLALMRPISGVAFCAPRCAYVEYAHSGARRLLGSGPPERQISRPGFRPHLQEQDRVGGRLLLIERAGVAERRRETSRWLSCCSCPRLLDMQLDGVDNVNAVAVSGQPGRVDTRRPTHVEDEPG